MRRERVLRWRVGAAALVVALLWLLPEVASGQLVLRALSDGQTADKSALASWAQEVRGQCARRPAAIGRMSLPTALAHIETRLGQHASSKALRAFAGSTDARTAGGAVNGVFAALGAGKPWAAIDATLRVQQLDPRDAGPLISLAGLVSAQGMPAEALALLDAARRLKNGSPAPMGISDQAIADNNCGYALLLLGRPQQAEGLLRTAVSMAPELAEAATNLDAAQQCAWTMLPGGSRGDPPVIAEPPFTRDPQKTAWTTDDDGNPVAVASSWLDLSQGTNFTAINVQLPAGPAEGKAMEDSSYLESLASELGSRSDAEATQSSALIYQLRHYPNLQTEQRTEAIQGALASVIFQPGLREPFDAYESAFQSLQQDQDNGTIDASKPSSDAYAAVASSGCGIDQACEDAVWTNVCTQETAALHAQWLARLKTVNDLELQWDSAYWGYMSGVAANFSNAALHQGYLLLAESVIDENRNLFAEDATFLTRMDAMKGLNTDAETCWGGPVTPPAAQAPASERGSQACPPALRAVKLVFKVDDVLKFGFTCETIDVEVSPAKWIGPFVNVGYNTRTGQTTVFTGGKLSVMPLGHTGKLGAFVTFGPDGSVVDGGIRASDTMSSNPGPVSLSTTKSADFSIAAAVSGR